MDLRRFIISAVIRNFARKQGFLDPVFLLSRLQRFSQPSEVMAPTELLRSGAVLHARGLVNSQAIQHNLDWVWPYWVERQFNPEDKSFVPRAFSITHINLTHRNWTAVGLPDVHHWPIVDPRGLLTPHYDSWSVDYWILADDGTELLPSRAPEAKQTITREGNLVIATNIVNEKMSIGSEVHVIEEEGKHKCALDLCLKSDIPAKAVVSLRPYNPEGVSFIHEIKSNAQDNCLQVNKKRYIHFSEQPDNYIFARYRDGDVYHRLDHQRYDHNHVECDVGMATAAADFKLEPGKPRTIRVTFPYEEKQKERPAQILIGADEQWDKVLQRACRLKGARAHINALYDIAVRTLIHHSPKEIYPGPYTYRRFWFRDAAFILDALLTLGYVDRVKRTINCFSRRQKPHGYFLSQEGEWDSNGEALWSIQRYCQMSGKRPDKAWKPMIDKGGLWIKNKRKRTKFSCRHSGLFPAGFSAEHLGPNDYYYWDDYWGVAGLRAASYLEHLYGDEKRKQLFKDEQEAFLRSIEDSLAKVEERISSRALPASPYRRLDAGSIGSIVGGYPLKIYRGDDERLKATADFLVNNFFIDNGFFQEMTHSGINPYLTLHVAQVLLRAGDMRFKDLVMEVAELASPTGQWPEAIHPITKGGCMGDGQHVWAAAEWVLMIRHCFVREEEESGKLILCSGCAEEIFGDNDEISFGPALTVFGEISVRIKRAQENIKVEWRADWHGNPPTIEVCLPGYNTLIPEKDQSSVSIEQGSKK